MKLGTIHIAAGEVAKTTAKVTLAAGLTAIAIAAAHIVAKVVAYELTISVAYLVLFGFPALAIPILLLQVIGVAVYIAMFACVAFFCGELLLNTWAWACARPVATPAPALAFG